MLLKRRIWKKFRDFTSNFIAFSTDTWSNKEYNIIHIACIFFDDWFQSFFQNFLTTSSPAGMNHSYYFLGSIIEKYWNTICSYDIEWNMLKCSKTGISKYHLFQIFFSDFSHFCTLTLCKKKGFFDSKSLFQSLHIFLKFRRFRVKLLWSHQNIACPNIRNKLRKLRKYFWMYKHSCDSISSAGDQGELSEAQERDSLGRNWESCCMK